MLKLLLVHKSLCTLALSFSPLMLNVSIICLVGSVLCRYGVILEKFQKQDPSLMGRIRGCIIDSAPVAAPDSQVYDSSAPILSYICFICFIFQDCLTEPSSILFVGLLG